ncbi:hypothetical protein H8K33_13530 [Undibacterium amnicola]|uniref:Apea-like HEPN domain-containing protein n=1 Tax=Undibacterium amnicola TaxID=1834038 RepID=A0ABR6XT33_9BURK|nr:hypothetical protein [Undibacterium amnicola]MBC3832523.1 hypothetical protein [Undibacterium amnicola]
MPLPPDFVASLECPSTEEIIQRTQVTRSTAHPSAYLELRNELKPIDLYCYFSARFGMPNGIQNFLRNDHSDNLVHWDWTLKHRESLIGFWGTNFRTDLFVIGELEFTSSERLELIDQIRADFKNHGLKMAAVREKLEHWTEFVNPYARLTRTIHSLRHELSNLDLSSPFSSEFNTPSSAIEQAKVWKAVTESHSRAYGLCFGIRSMLPVWAEAFLNLLIFVLARPDVKSDNRLMESIYRQQIDVRIRGLHLSCIGFEKPIDFKTEACKNFHRLINERNDLLHGNVVPEKQKFNEVYFLGKVPVFKEYRSLWDRTLAVEGNSVGIGQLDQEIQTVENFVAYVLSCLKQNQREFMQAVLRKRDLATNIKDGRFGVLFPDHLIDSRPVFEGKNTTVAQSADDSCSTDQEERQR